MKTHIGSCEFPSAKFGLAKAYELPDRFDDEEEFDQHLIDTRNYMPWGKRLADLNEELPFPEDYEEARSICHGANSRFLPTDIQFFLRIGGGSNLSKTEEKMSLFLENQTGKRINWILSPYVALLIGKRELGVFAFARLFSLFCIAKTRRMLGTHEERDEVRSVFIEL